ncbi:MAG: NAD(P)-dependent oxidoreductase [Gemmatimonadota bacterium]|jgi:UDP-glucose 4-epimerase
MSEKIMVTGAAGFVGARLVGRLLAEGAEVHAFDVQPLDEALRLRSVRGHEGLHYRQGDLRDAEAVEAWYRADASHLYHLASVVGVHLYMDDPLALIDVVVGGTRTLLDLAVRHGTRVLFTSTSEVYGKNPRTPWAETDDRVLGPPSVDRWSYSSSKAVCEHMLHALHHGGKLDFTTVRFFNVYGPGQAPIFVVSQSIHRALHDRPPLLYDTGRQTRCFTYVDDAVEGMMSASRAEAAVGKVLNIGSDVETTIAEVVRKVIEASGQDLEPEIFRTEVEYGAVYEDIPRRVPDVSRAKALLGWQATTPLEEGIRRTMEWVRENPWWLEQPAGAGS